VMALEFFHGPDGLQVNEIAPRTHNSGHFSIDACSSSQFDQQLCIVAGLPVPTPQLTCDGALMVNLLGLPPGGHVAPLDERLNRLRERPDSHLHWYGKTPETPGRKMGHITVLLRGAGAASRREEALRARDDIRRVWPVCLDCND
jgi:5-(carboxyamino)imidazole ribonucleotide synthase